MKAHVVSFRRGRSNQIPRHFIIDVNVATRKEAAKFLGKEVEWKSKGKNVKTIKGKITSCHGNNGLVRCVFEKGLPGQAINDEVNVI